MKLLKSMYGLFKDYPVFQNDYICQTVSTVFIKMFCHLYWVANVDVATHAIKVVP